MSELKTLMSQHIDLLKTQIEQQNKSLELSKTYMMRLIEQNNILEQEIQQKDELISALKSEIRSIASKQPSKAYLAKFEETMNQLLQLKLKSSLEQLNIHALVNQQIQTKLAPLQQQLYSDQQKISQELSRISTLHMPEDNQEEESEIVEKLKQLENSITSLRDQMLSLK